MPFMFILQTDDMFLGFQLSVYMAVRLNCFCEILGELMPPDIGYLVVKCMHHDYDLSLVLI